MARIRRDSFIRYAIAIIGIGLILETSRTAGATATTAADIPRLQAAAQQGSIDNEIELAAAYFTGRGVPQDETMAAHWYEKAAEAGDPEAQKQIGFFYEAGIGVTADPARAVQWYQRAVSAGLVSAKVDLAVAYVWGLGVPRDQPFAARLFRDAVKQGDGTAASYLGDMYYFGLGVDRDKDAAEKWYATGVRMHDPIAAFNLAFLNSTDNDHRHDFSRAVELLRESAASGYVPAMHSLGLLLVNHPELASSPQEAISQLEISADAGTWKSSAVLGALSREGKLVPMDDRTAYSRFRAAALQGGEDARRVVSFDLRKLSAKLGSEETQRLDLEADRWHEQHHVALAFVYRVGDNERRFPAYARAVSSDATHAGRLIPAPPA